MGCRRAFLGQNWQGWVFLCSGRFLSKAWGGSLPPFLQGTDMSGVWHVSLPTCGVRMHVWRKVYEKELESRLGREAAELHVMTMSVPSGMRISSVWEMWKRMASLRSGTPRIRTKRSRTSPRDVAHDKRVKLTRSSRSRETPTHTDEYMHARIHATYYTNTTYRAQYTGSTRPNYTSRAQCKNGCMHRKDWERVCLVSFHRKSVVLDFPCIATWCDLRFGKRGLLEKGSLGRDLIAIAICDSNRESQITSDLRRCEPSQKSSLFWLVV